MRRSGLALAVVVFGLAGALVGVAPSRSSALGGAARWRATAFVTNTRNGTVSTIDVKTKTKDSTDIPVGTGPIGVAVTPDGKTAFVTNFGAELGDSGTVSTID